MQFRHNTYANRAAGALTYSLLFIASSAMNLAIAYDNVVVHSDESNTGLGIFSFFIGTTMLMYFVPFKLTHFFRLMGQAIRQDNELGLEEDVETRTTDRTVMQNK